MITSFEWVITRHTQSFFVSYHKSRKEWRIIMFCSNCGKEVNNNAKFCEFCGTTLNNNSQAPAQNTYSNQDQPPQNPRYSNAPPVNQAPYNQPPVNQQPVNQVPYNQAPINQSNYVNSPQTPPPQKPRRKKGCGCLIGAVVVVAIFVVIVMLLPSDWLEEEVPDNAYDNSPDSLFDDTPVDDSVSDDYVPVESTTGLGTYGTPMDINGLRDFYTAPVGDGSDIHTIMVYLIGSDLETDGGFASTDIYEMLEADIGDNVNLILMTGGATTWQMSDIRSDTCQYWQVKNGELISVNPDLGLLNMSDPNTLTQFINTTTTNFPADRYSVILWNHGGGTISGFGYDEHYPDDTLTLASIEDAFAQTNVKFDFIGFDACLMATAETAYMLEPYADYLIASQELEPGGGWYYTDWLTNLSNNPSMTTLDLAVNIIDDFITACENDSFFPNATLSVVELRQMPYTYEKMTKFLANSIDDIQNNEYVKLSHARSDAKDFGDGGNDQIDLVDYVLKSGVDGSQELVDAVSSAVKYYYNSYDVDNAYGLAMYFPYDYISHYSSVQDILFDVGYTSTYTDFFDMFISAMSGGQTQYNRSSGVTPEQDYSSEEWYDTETASAYEQSYDSHLLEDLIIDEKGDGYVLSLTDEQWEDIITIELQVMLDDGEGYIDLGSDNVYEFDEDGDLMIEFDYTWVSIDGHTVPFYAEEEIYNSDTDWFTNGYVPAFVNDEYVEIIIHWDNENPTGYVAGYRKYTEVGEPAGKGLFDLEAGDTVEWIVDYYTYEGEYDFYTFGDIYTVPDAEMLVSYEYVGDYDAMVYFVLTDTFNNVYETEAVIYSDY